MIRIRGLTAGYGALRVLENLHLELYAGAMVGLIGPNGCGKSTLLKLLMGLMQPASGEVRLIGRPVSTFGRNVLARQMTLVPQDTQIGFELDVEDIVAMGRNPHLGRFRVPKAHDLEMIRTAMIRTGVQGLARRSVDTLSGGERQRVVIARAIAQETPIVLLDEVTANLDLCHQLEVLELVRGLAVSGRLVVASIHDLAMASRYCDRLLLLAECGIRADGPPRSVLTEQNLRRYFNVEARIRAASEGVGLSIEPLASVGAVRDRIG
jgi:iron complex transport system ATP-binding protein